VNFVSRWRYYTAAEGLRALRYLHASYIDLRLWLTRKNDPDLPPMRLRGFVGQGDFRVLGSEVVELLIKYGGLSPSFFGKEWDTAKGQIAFARSGVVVGTDSGIPFQRRVNIRKLAE
jgi:hypothetical protein